MRLKPSRRWLVLGFTAAVVALACGYLVLGYSPAATRPVLGGQFVQASVKVGDRARSYHSYVPARLPNGAPLVIVFHGSSMDGETMRAWTGYRFDVLADAQRFAVAYPDGYKGNWNDCRKHASFPAKRENVDDAGFVRELVRQFVRQHGVDSEKVYLFGYSNGGQMATRLAIQTPKEISAVAVAAANLPVSDNDECAATGETSRMMLVSGTADPLVPFAGGEVTMFGFASRGFALSADETAHRFAARNGLSNPTSSRLPHRSQADPTSVERRVWTRDGTPYVEQYTVRGGGHVVPQRAFRFPRILGRTTSDLDAPAEAVRFFLHPASSSTP